MDTYTLGAKMTVSFTLVVLMIGVIPVSMRKTGKLQPDDLDDIVGYCEFPEFLTAAFADQSERTWVTRSHYATSQGNWTNQREITVRHTVAFVKVVSRSLCRQEGKANSTFTCSRRDLVQSIICLAEEPEQKYRVQIRTNGREEFSCLKFIRRNGNLVQVWSASPKSVNEDILCYDSSLERDPWPWIASQKDEWNFCPLKGGFDFRAHLEGSKRKVCKHQWRPSRMESECILGEGLQFYFPDERCSIFEHQPLAFHLYCWGSWEEEDYTFIILGEDGFLPQFSLRLPNTETSSFKQFTAYFYYNPVTPLRLNGRPPGDIIWAELRMLRSDPGICYDESEKCPDFAREGKCTNTALHKYANYCKKSCGLCDFVPSVRAECRFPREYRTDWLLYETDRMEEVSIEDGQVSFSELGTFICKSKHWAANRYKLFSFYNNGCRPRYTCMHFRRNNEILQFRLGRSELSDRSFDLCHFKDDPLPLGGKIRSGNLKILLPKERAIFGECGLDGIAHVNATFPDSQSCDGTMSDWDSEQCQSHAKLSFSLYPCGQNNWIDYFCVVYVDIEDGFSVLLTKLSEAGHSDYQCWLIRRPIGQQNHGHSWRSAFLLDSGQCQTEGDLSDMSQEYSLLAVNTYSDIIDTNKKCHNPFKLKDPHPSTPRPANQNGPNDIVINEQPVVAEGDTRYTVLPPPTERPGREMRDHDSNSQPKGFYTKSQNHGAFLSRSSFVGYIVAFLCLLQPLDYLAL